MSPLPAPAPRPERFEGHDGRDCGEHRTTGPRAWCPTCQEWCYPDIPCRGCELPLLRARAEKAEAALQRVHAFAVTEGTVGRDLVCPCSVPRTAPDQPEEPR